MTIEEDLNHYFNIVSGCEAITSGNRTSYESHYAFAVLKLHAQDVGLIAGTEGFLDHIKKGAKNIKDWIAKAIKAIWDFFKSPTVKDIEPKVKNIKRDYADWIKESQRANREPIEDLLVGTHDTCLTILEPAYKDISDSLKSSYSDWNLVKESLKDFPDMKQVADKLELLIKTIQDNKTNMRPLDKIKETFDYLKPLAERANKIHERLHKEVGDNYQSDAGKLSTKVFSFSGKLCSLLEKLSRCVKIIEAELKYWHRLD